MGGRSGGNTASLPAAFFIAPIEIKRPPMYRAMVLRAENLRLDIPGLDQPWMRLIDDGRLASKRLDTSNGGWNWP